MGFEGRLAQALQKQQLARAAGGEAQRRGTLFFLTILLTRQRIKKRDEKTNLCKLKGVFCKIGTSPADI